MAAKRKAVRRRAKTSTPAGVPRRPVTAGAVTAKSFAAALARIATLEAQVSRLCAALQLAGGDVTLAASGALVVRASSMQLESAGGVQVTTSRIDVAAGMAQYDVGILKVSGVVSCDVMHANSVIATTYTPGAGNVL